MKYPYIPSPSKFGRYAVLSPETAMKIYPTPLPVPVHIPRPSYVPRNFFTAPWGDHELPNNEDEVVRGVRLGTEEEIEVRKAGKMAGEVLKLIGGLIRPGITTSEIDSAVHEEIIRLGAYPSTLGYGLFPKSCTTSVNNVIAHGIPDDRPLLSDDIVNLDLTIYLNGWHGDCSRTFLLPSVDEQGKELVHVTEEALEAAIGICEPGRPYRDIGRVIQDLAEKHDSSVNTQFGGHGIGKSFHQPPWILHHRNDEQGEMKIGDCFTIEPPLVQGSRSKVQKYVMISFSSLIIIFSFSTLPLFDGC
ncbi:methionine aminopeptidase, type I [Tremella mesenterica]|uniref:Methionine aminopeptidase n=1 Tax=Tremella mesenterica TaxID=5217 RepID=A0A4Q1BG68_TREME|nr:methionine aminopeptidase, type I [Tremella mesenterica]